MKRLNPELVIDVGAHNGDDAAHYLSRGFRVVAIEANPLLAASLRRRLADDVSHERAVVEEVGIAERSGCETFFVNRVRSEYSAFDPDVAARGGSAAPIVVPCVTMSHIFAKHGVPYFLKVDIEGRDGLCLEALNPADLPVFVSVEAHQLEYVVTLWAKGYREFRVVDQLEHDRPPLPGSNERAHERLLRAALHLSRRLRVRVGRAGGRFPPGSSGPVPDESPGGWADLETVTYEWLHIKRGYRKRGALNHRGWFDFHARRPA